MKPHLTRVKWEIDGKWYWVCRSNSVRAFSDAPTEAYEMWRRSKEKKDAFNFSLPKALAKIWGIR